MTTMRVALDADKPALVGMGMALLRSEYAGSIRPNPDAIGRTLDRMLATETARAWVAERDGIVVGTIGGWVYEHPMSGDLIATEVMWWVDPTARGYGLRLRNLFKQWAREQGARRLTMMSPSPETDQLYERLGLVAIERTYQEELS